MAMRFGAAAGLIAAMLSFTPAGAGEVTVVELFTSQGCSSCPPADSILGELAQRDDIIALSEHVDYWDYIGWKDTFADPWHTVRQRGYADHLGKRTIYTPQLVINGQTDAVGSRRAQVEARLKSVAKANVAEVTIAHSNDGLTIKIDGPAIDEDAMVWLVQFDDKEQVNIGRGENSGTKITYHNVVKSWAELGTWSGGAGSYTLSKSQIDGTAEGCAVLVQIGGTGQIIGAAKMVLMPSS